MEVKKVAEEWEIWNKEKEAVKLEEETKRLVLERFHKQIHVSGKKTSKRMPMRKILDHAIELKKGFVLRKRKVYMLSREKREEVYKFIKEQLRKEYIRLLKSSQIAPMFLQKRRTVRSKWFRTIYI